MKNYCLYNDRVEFAVNDRRNFTIYFNENSGKVYFCYKNGEEPAKHPGVFLGVDAGGNGYFLHNQDHYGKAHISPELEFRKNMQIYSYKEKWNNSPLKVIEYGLNDMLRGNHFNPFAYKYYPLASKDLYYQNNSGDFDFWLIAVFIGMMVMYMLN